MGGLGSELDPLCVHRGGHPRDLDGLPRGGPRGVRGQVDGGSEPPGAVHDHADREAAVVAIGQALQPAVGKGDALSPDPFDPEISVLCAERARLVESGVGEFLQWQARELGVDPSVVIIHASRTYLTGLPAPHRGMPGVPQFPVSGLIPLVKNWMIEWFFS